MSAGYRGIRCDHGDRSHLGGADAQRAARAVRRGDGLFWPGRAGRYSGGARLGQTHATVYPEDAARAPELAVAPTRRLVSHAGVDATERRSVPEALAASPGHLLQHLVVSVDQPSPFALTLGGDQRLKSVPRVIHDRMAARPFMKLRDFDLERFVDYGRPFYDNNHVEKGKLFARAARVNRKREAEQQKAREKRVRAQRRASRR